MNKGRDFYRAQQAECKRIRQRGYLPTEKTIGKTKVFILSDRTYQKRHVKNKAFKVIDAAGKERLIPYQTCTYVRVSPERLHEMGGVK
jgi:hypothetical protein